MRTPLAMSAALLLAIPAALLGQVPAPVPAGGATTSAPTTTPPTTSAPATKLTSVTPLLGQSRLTGAQIAAWFAKQRITPAITTPMDNLAQIFVDEGNAQNVRGDIAFAQSVLETGWFVYRGSMVKPTDNNYSGLGACDTCSRGALFATPQDGVRAQIQHLWIYGDPNASVAGLARPLIDPRFMMVSPAGKSPTWEQMGDGNWATGANYAVKVLGIYNTMLVFNGLTPINLTTGPATTPAATVMPSGPLTVMVSRAGGVRLGDLRARAGTLASAAIAFGGKGQQRAAYGACHVTWSSLGAIMAFSGSSSGTCGGDARVRAAVLTNPIWRTDKGISPGDGVAKVRRAYRLKAKRPSGSVILVRARNGASLTAKIGEGVVKSLVVAVPRSRV